MNYNQNIVGVDKEKEIEVNELSWRFWTVGEVHEFKSLIASNEMEYFRKAMNKYFNRNWSLESLEAKQCTWYKGISTQKYKSGTIENIRCCAITDRQDDVKYLDSGFFKYARLLRFFEFNLEGNKHQLTFVQCWNSSSKLLIDFCDKIENASESKLIKDLLGLPLLQLSECKIIPIGSIVDRVRMFP